MRSTVSISISRSTLDKTAFALMLGYAVVRISAVFFNVSLYGLPTWLLLGSASIALISTATALITQISGGSRPSKNLLLLGSLIGLLLIAVGIQAIVFDELFDASGRSSISYTASMLFVNLCWLSIGTSIQRIDLKNSFMKAFVILAFLASAIITNLDDGLIISYSNIAASSSNNGELDHLVVGESAVLLVVLSYVIAPNKWRLVVFPLGLAILFSLGGRTALFTYAGAVTFHLILKSDLRHLYAYAGMLLTFTILFSLNYFSLDIADSSVARMLLSDGLGEDESVAERLRLLSRGLEDLPSQILIGNAASLVKSFGSLGSYIHNILSAWQFFGFFAFALIVIINLRIMKRIYMFRKFESTAMHRFGELYFIYALISVVTGKYIGFSPLWLVMGFWLMKTMPMSASNNSIYLRSKS